MVISNFKKKESIHISNLATNNIGWMDIVFTSTVLCFHAHVKHQKNVPSFNGLKEITKTVTTFLSQIL